MANSINDATKTYTLDQFVNMKNSDGMTYYNFSILEKIGDIFLPDRNVVDDYIDELNSLCVKCELDNEQYKKYKYSPDFLAFDVYGSTQLDFIILLVNDMIDPGEFDLKVIKLPYASKLKKFLSAVYNSEYRYISGNRADNKLTVF